MANARPPATIACMECGGECFLLYEIKPDDEYEGGDIVAYRCPDCRERWDMEITEDDLTDD